MRTPGSYKLTPARESRIRAAEGPPSAEDRTPEDRPRCAVEGARLGNGTRRGAGSTDGLVLRPLHSLLVSIPLERLLEAPRFDRPPRSALRGGATSPRTGGASAGAVKPERPRSKDSREVEGWLGGA